MDWCHACILLLWQWIGVMHVSSSSGNGLAIHHGVAELTYVYGDQLNPEEVDGGGGSGLSGKEKEELYEVQGSYR